MIWRGVLAAVVAAVVAVLVPAAVPAQQPAAAAALLPALSYEAWKHSPAPPLGFRGWGYEPYRAWPRGYFGLWDHDEPLAVRTARVAAYAATLAPGYVNRGHPRYYAILDPTNLPGEGGDTAVAFAPYQQRFLDEALAGGDVVVPFAGRREEGGALHPMFAVFAAGTPPERIALLLVATLGQRETAWLSPEEMVAVVRAWRATLGLETTEEFIREVVASFVTEPHPAPTYEEWVYGVYLPFPRLWPHTTPDDTSRARTAAFWRSSSLEFNADLRRFTGHAAVLDIGDGEDDAHEARWLAEALAAGDLVLPFPRPVRSEADPRFGRTVPAFLVFEAGAPSAAVATIAEAYLTRAGVPAATMSAILSAYAAAVPPATP